MKKLLGIVALGLICFSVVSAQDNQTRLEFNDGLTILSGDEWGGEILIIGPGTRKDGLDRWAKRVKLVESGEPQRKFCKIFGLDSKPFKFKNNMKSKETSITKSKKSYSGKTYDPLLKKFRNSYSQDTYSENMLAFTISKFECKNDKVKPKVLNNDLIAEIEKLKALYEEGTLTKEQFEKAKNKLLN